MNQLRLLFFAVCLSVLCQLRAAESPVRASLSKPWVWGVEKLSFRRHVQIANQHNFYRLDLVQWQAEKNQPPKINFWLHEPKAYGNFSRPIMDFFQLQVNGISERQLYIHDETLRLWENSDNSAGADIQLNFNGAKLLLRWFMRPGSALLHGLISVAPDSSTVIKDIMVKLQFMPSAIAKDDNGKVLYGNAYARQAITPLRLLQQNKQAQVLQPEDAYLILQDTIFDGSSEGKGAGPCYISFDYQGVQQARLNMDNSWLCSLIIELDPAFKSFHFALWQHKNSFSNQEFQQYFTENRSLFQLH